MLGTMPAATAARASSRPLQCVTGTPTSFGALHANAMIAASCSAENFEGAPLRSSSASTSTITSSSSSSDALFASASASRPCASTHRLRQRRHRCASTPISRACDAHVAPDDDKRIIATRSASRFGNVRERDSRSMMARCRTDNSMEGARRDMRLP